MTRRATLMLMFALAMAALAACDPLRAYVRTAQVLDQRLDLGCVEKSLVHSEGREHVSSNGHEIGVKPSKEAAAGFSIGVRISQLESGSSRLEAYSQAFRDFPDDQLARVEREQRRLLLGVLHDCGGTSAGPTLRCATWPSGIERPSCFGQ